MNRWTLLAGGVLLALAVFLVRPDAGGESGRVFAAGVLLVAALTFVFGYLRGRWRALAEVGGLAAVALSSDFVLMAVGVYRVDGPATFPGMFVVLTLPVVLPLVACGVAARRRRQG